MGVNEIIPKKARATLAAKEPVQAKPLTRTGIASRFNLMSLVRYPVPTFLETHKHTITDDI